MGLIFPYFDSSKQERKKDISHVKMKRSILKHWWILLQLSKRLEPGCDRRYPLLGWHFVILIKSGVKNFYYFWITKVCCYEKTRTIEIWRTLFFSIFTLEVIPVGINGWHNYTDHIKMWQNWTPLSKFEHRFWYHLILPSYQSLLIFK